MTPAARISAAIEILDAILDGYGAEAALGDWAKRSRFAGSKDRAAVRDHVFDALRCRRSFAVLGGSQTGRGLMIGAARDQGGDMEMLFSGEGHAPEPLSRSEAAAPRALTRAEGLDWPDWLMPAVDAALGEGAEAALAAMRGRGPLTLRVNTAKCDIATAQAALAAEGISTVPVDGIDGALRVTENPRRVQMSEPFSSGLVEIQDASSQAAVQTLTVLPEMRVLDYCAGGGGKSLALAARGANVTAFDIAPRRMADIPLRAARAGATIQIIERLEDIAGQFPLVFCDAPCSGSGTWRRTPEAKWALTPQMLASYRQTQIDVLRNAAPFVSAGGVLAYATCSILREENEDSVDAFLTTHRDFALEKDHRWPPSEVGDGFYLAVLRSR